MGAAIFAVYLELTYVLYRINHSSEAHLLCSMICGLPSVYVVELPTEQQFTQEIHSLTVLCTTIYAVRAECN